MCGVAHVRGVTQRFVTQRFGLLGRVLRELSILYDLTQACAADRQGQLSAHGVESGLVGAVCESCAEQITQLAGRIGRAIEDSFRFLRACHCAPRAAADLRTDVSRKRLAAFKRE